MSGVYRTKEFGYIVGFWDFSEELYDFKPIKIQAKTNFGNSGSPVFDEDGRVQTIDLLDDVREVTVSYDRFGSKSIRVPEYSEMDEDGLTK